MNNKRAYLIFGMAVCCLLLSSACIWPTVSALSDLSAAVTQTWEALSRFSSQTTEESPATVESTQEQEQQATTATSTPGPPMISVSVDTNCRSGPGVAYDYLGALMTYEEAEVLARGSEPGFWVIENLDNLGTECWVGEQYAVIEGDTSGLPVRTPPPTPTPEEPVPSLASIAGFVYFDGNNNGHFGDPQDAPLPNSLVVLMEGDCPGGPVITTILTDGSGGYIFSDLQSGLYCIIASNPTYLPHDYEINLDPGQHVVGVNFRDIP